MTGKLRRAVPATDGLPPEVLAIARQIAGLEPPAQRAVVDIVRLLAERQKRVERERGAVIAQ